MDVTDIVMFYMFLTLTAAVIFSLSFWVWMLADCLKRKNFKGRTLWLVIILVMNVIGGVIYFLVIKNKNK